MHLFGRSIVCGALVLLIAAGPGVAGQGQVIERRANDTLTALELDRGDTLKFTLPNGQPQTLVLEDTTAGIIERVEPGGIVYHFTCRIRIDGHPMTLRRYVCSQEAFYEPYVVNGMRIWPDIVKDVFDLIPVRYPKKGNLQCLPRKAARFALQDATLSICPQRTRPWHPSERNFIDCKDNYNGDDCYLGPYLGRACHVGMDINHPKGDPLFAPIDFDDQCFFNSLAAGHDNNRWRGVRRWPNGDVWALQSHHLIKLLVPEHTPLSAGTKYATTAGVHVGSHEHTHYEFKIGHNPDREMTLEDFDDQSEAAQQDPAVIHLDPWIVFRQTFEDRRARDGEIRAAIKPLCPARTGREVTFSAENSRSGSEGGKLSCYWTFGDGGWSRGAAVTHTFARGGVYPVTLVVDDGVGRAACTQHITVDGEPIPSPALALAAPDEPAFRPRPVHAMDVYGWPVEFIPHTLEFVARESRPVPNTKAVVLKNLGGGDLPEAAPPTITYLEGTGWLALETKGACNGQTLDVTVDAAGIKPGSYSALVWVDCPGAVNSPQGLRVVLGVPEGPPASEVTIDDRDAGFYGTPYFWVGHRFCRCPKEKRGFGDFYLTSGGRATAGEFARFTPDLQAGKYEVSFSERTPFGPETQFNVRVRHRLGERIVRVQPCKSRTIGTFEFDEGTDGYVEIRAGGSKGLVIADAIDFRLADR